MPRRSLSTTTAEIVIPTDPGALLNVPQTCALLNCSRGTLYALLRRGDLKPIKILTATRFMRAELDRYLMALQGSDHVPASSPLDRAE